MQKSNNQSFGLPVWVALLITASIALSLAFACAAPFVALATVAALTLPRKAAYWLVGSTWLGNQLVGYMLLDYPQTLNSFAWGAVIGCAAMLCVLIGQTIERNMQKRPYIERCIGIFITSFLAYEMTLFTASFALGATEDFTIAIIGRILAINIIALGGLLTANWLNSATGFLPLPAAVTR